jgi:hypothetical protein
LPNVSFEQAWDWSLETVRQAVARAEARQVTICFEPLGPAETNFINTAEEAIKLVQQVASAYLKMLLDVKAMSSEAKPIPQIIVKELKQNPTNNIIAEIAWTQNKLYFEDESLENIAPMLERWFGKKVEITNVSLKNLRYYGNFEKETMEEVLSYLKLSKRFNFKIEPDSVLIY